MTEPYRKKLIEISLPLDEINGASLAENANPFMKGHPKSMKWWARRPLAACRATLFASLIDDPSSNPQAYPDEPAQQAERQRLHDLLSRLCQWENIQDEGLLDEARREIQASAANGELPVLCDPFAGGGSIPLEAQRLGLVAHSSDINPVAVLINRVLLQLPARFSDRAPCHPVLRKQRAMSAYRGASGLADDVRAYGQMISQELRDSIGGFWPEARVPGGPAGGSKVVAWIWARTVKSPDPAWDAEVPLVRSFELSSRGKARTWAEPVIDRETRSISFRIETGEGPVPDGTVSKDGARCLATGTPISFDYIRAAGKRDEIGTQLIAVVVEAKPRKEFVSPDAGQIAAALSVPAVPGPDTELPDKALGFRVQAYGMSRHRQLFTARQLFALEKISEAIISAADACTADAVAAGMDDDEIRFIDGGAGAQAYSDAVRLLLAEALARSAMFHGSLCKWNKTNENIANPFAMMTLSMTWDFAEGNPLDSPTDFGAQCEKIAEILEQATCRSQPEPDVFQLDARHIDERVQNVMFSTDPPYYDNAGYADLSDYFYVWLRPVVAGSFPDDCATLLTPKSAELIASPDRHDGSKVRAKEFFEEGLRDAFAAMRRASNPEYPFTIHYAFKQQESVGSASGQTSTGWETMLEGLRSAGWMIVGTWPLRTEREARSRSQGSNALASSIVLVCRQRPDDAPMATRKELLARLKAELPAALRVLREQNTAPVDLAQAAIGPGMAVYTQYAKVIDADGHPLTVRGALALITETVDEVLTEQEGAFDADTRWALAWFEQFGFSDGEYGIAETLSRAKNTSVQGMVEAGILASGAGRVRLLRPDELPEDWDPAKDARLTIWEAVHHLVQALDRGEVVAASLVRRLGSVAETARELAYRLYTVCERKKRAREALSYNALVQSWPELVRLAAEPGDSGQQSLGV